MGRDNHQQYIISRIQSRKYPLDEYFNELASYTPLIIISQQMDGTTPFDQASQLTSIIYPTRTFCVIRLVGYVTINIVKIGCYSPLELICSSPLAHLNLGEWNSIQSLSTRIDFVEPIQLE